MFDLMSMTYQIQGGIPVVYIFARDLERKRRIFKDKNFRPYFYKPGSEITDALNRPVSKFVYDLPTKTRMLRSQYEYTCEADVRFVYRYLIDKQIYCSFVVDNGTLKPTNDNHIPPRILYFDIEVKCPQEKLPRPENPIYPIVAISTMDSYTDDIKVFVQDDEVALINEFINYVVSLDPDIITGWAIEIFDLPYLVERCKKLRVPYSRLSPIGFVEQRKKFKIGGREVVDELEAFKKWYKTVGEMDTWDLKTVAQRIADFKYEDYGDRIAEIDKETLVNYGKNDVMALAMIDRKIGLLEFYDHLRRIAGCLISDALSNEKLIDMLILRNRTHPLPTKPKRESDESYKGALVRSPPVGVHENVALYDLKTLYPYLILAFGLSPDVDKVLVKTIGRILEEREKLRGKPEFKQREIALKFLACSFYGVMGYPNFRLFSLENASKITALGRELNMYLAEQAIPYNAIYGDTDSIFIKVPNLDEAIKLETKLQESLRVWAKEKQISMSPELKFEKFFRKIFFKIRSGADEPAKKRYAGHVIYENGQPQNYLYIVGLEPRRSDSSVVTRVTMRRFFEKLLLEDDVSGALNTIKFVYKNLDKFPLNEIGIPKGLHKDKYEVENPWLVGCQVATAQFGFRFREDRKPRLLYTISGPICITEDIEKLNINIDWQTMKDKIIRQKFESILKSIGFTWDNVMFGQRTLDSYAY